jgi:hypothetical protein
MDGQLSPLINRKKVLSIELFRAWRVKYEGIHNRA